MCSPPHRLGWGRARCAAGFALALAGCFAEPNSYPNGGLLCSSPERACPSGYLCQADGHCWQDGTQPLLAECTPGQRRCGAAETPQACDASGAWQPEAACANLCLGDGQCGGQCRPGTTSCAPGDAPTLISCDDRGQPVAMPCPFVCLATTGSCGGVCTPGAIQCSDNSIAECNALGQWSISTTCSRACRQGVCVPSS